MRFETTNWSLIVRATGESSSAARTALAGLCETYWPPVYAFIRRRGLSPADAEDLTQSYFARFFEKDYLRDFRPEAGRFRTFLRASISHFLSNEWDRERALKRGGGKVQVSFDAATAEERLRLEPVDRLTPEAIFERTWAAALLARCLERLREEQKATGGEERFLQAQGVPRERRRGRRLRGARARARPERVDAARGGPPPAPALRRRAAGGSGATRSPTPRTSTPRSASCSRRCGAAR